MPNLKNKQFAEKDNQDFSLARDFGDECLQYTTDPGGKTGPVFHINRKPSDSSPTLKLNMSTGGGIH